MLGFYQIRDRTTFFGIALLIPKKRSPLALLSQAMAVLKFNQQDDSE
ncbi:MAG: hypothetical protein ACK525_05390 [Microcystis sp.]